MNYYCMIFTRSHYFLVTCQLMYAMRHVSLAYQSIFRTIVSTDNQHENGKFNLNTIIGYA